MRKNPQHWQALNDGLVPDSWPLLGIITAPTMLNMDGMDHIRLRSLIQKAFTSRPVEALRPRIAEITRKLLDDLAAAGPGTVMDLRSQFAFQLPMRVICELYGVDDPDTRQQLAADSGRLLSSQTPPAERLGAQAAIGAAMAKLVAEKRAAPGGDLTTALINAYDNDDRMSEDELVGTLFLMLIAGHETTQNLLTNAIKNLLEHPAQLDLILEGRASEDPWRGVVEESLRLDAPAATIMFLYPVANVTVAGVTIRAGSPVMIHAAAIGRDDQVFIAPDRFVSGRDNAHQHRAFGHGVHRCLGAHLARLEARIALPALHERFIITPAEKLSELEPLDSLSSNSVARLPVRLRERNPAPK
ncbi:cytochrome P450 family protein [Streptomyces montanus]|nr:cytochrome P450 [Streptomyces montanus]